MWDAESGKEFLTLRGHSDWVANVTFSRDGRRFATASGDGTVQIYTFDLRELLNLAPSRVTRTFAAGRVNATCLYPRRVLPEEWFETPILRSGWISTNCELLRLGFSIYCRRILLVQETLRITELANITMEMRGPRTS